MNRFKKIFSVSFFAAICLIIFKIFCFASKWICVHSESLFCPYTVWASGDVTVKLNNFTDMFFHSDHCWFVYSFLYSFIEKNMPLILNLHPQEAIRISSKLILFPVFMLFLLTITLSLFKYSKSKKLIYWGLGLFYSFLLVMNAFNDSHLAWIFYSSCWTIAYIFLPIFGIAFYNIAEYFYVTERKPSSKFAFFIITALFLCIAVSHEYYKFLLLLMTPAIYLLHHIVFKIKIERKKFLKQALVYIFLTFVTVLNNFTYSYTNWLSDHVNNSESIFSIIADKSFLLTYIKSFTDFLILNNLSYIILIIALTLYIFFTVKDKNRNKRFIIFSYTTIFVAYLFFIVTITGSEQYDNFVNFVIPSHEGLRCLLKYTFITIFLSGIGYLIKYHDSGIRKYIAVFGFAGLCLLGKNNFLQMDNWHFFQKQVKTNSYIIEKMFVLNKKINNDNIYYSYNNSGMFNDHGIKYMVYLYKSDYTPKEYSVYHVCLPEDNLDTCKNKMIQTVFEKTGYQFTKQELEELNFSSLYELNKNGI